MWIFFIENRKMMEFFKENTMKHAFKRHFNTMNDENWPFLALKHIQNTPFHDKIYNTWWKFTTCGEKMTFLNTLFNATLWWKMDISYKTPPLAVEWPPFYTKMDTSHTGKLTILSTQTHTNTIQNTPIPW